MFNRLLQVVVNLGFIVFAALLFAEFGNKNFNELTLAQNLQTLFACILIAIGVIALDTSVNKLRKYQKRSGNKRVETDQHKKTAP